MTHILALACAVLLTPTDPGELTVTDVHGGWLRALHGSRTTRTIWIAGDGGLIRRSEDDGDTFLFEPTPRDPAVNVQLEGIFLIDEGPHAGRGLAVGTGRTILRRDPADASWSRVEPKLLPPPVAGAAAERLTDVVLVDGGREGDLDILLGWVVGEGGVLWHLREEYRDGERVSAAWLRQEGNVALPGEQAVPFTRPLFSVHAVREESGDPGASGDAGAPGPLHLYAGGDWGLLLHSSDLGHSWIPLDVPGRGPPGDDPATSFDIQDVFVRPDGRGAAVGGAWVKGKVGWVVSIGGFTEVLPNALGAAGCPPAVPCAIPNIAWRGSLAYGVCALEDGRFLAVSYGSDTWRSPRAGPRWSESTYKPLPSADRALTPPLRDVALAGPGEEAALYAIGHHGTVRRALDPSASPLEWEQLTGQFVIRVDTGDFIDRQRGWIGGVSGPIVATTDGGRTFAVACEAAGGSVMALDVVAEDSGVAAGYRRVGRGRVPYVAFLDGDGWHERSGKLPGAEGYKGALTDVHAAGGRFWTVGSGGFAGWSDDGGARWNDASLPRSLAVLLEAVAALDRDQIVVAGHSGVAALRTVGEGPDAWVRLAVRATTDDPRYVADGDYTGDLMALGHDSSCGRTIAVGSGGYLFELDLAARAFSEIHRDGDARDLTVVAVAPDGSIFAGGAGNTFLWHDAPAGTWQPANSRISMGPVEIVPIDAGEGYLIGYQSMLKRYAVTR